VDACITVENPEKAVKAILKQQHTTNLRALGKVNALILASGCEKVKELQLRS
jgi:hypothetical protein|tara:strand:+ start:3835 stop:3990 length:156 start_codon:yes stop_codon:yes gene_type:complete